LFHPDIGSDSLKLTVQILGTGEALVGVISQGEFKDIAPQMLQLRSISLDLHSFGSRGSAGSGEAGHPLNFYYA